MLKTAAAAAAASPLAAQERQLFRSPYLQNVGRDRATLIWATRERGDGAVRYSTDRSYSNSVPARVRPFPPTETGQGVTYYEYRAELGGLAPGIEYFYQVTVDGQVPSPAPDDTRFRTAASGPFQFLAFGDSGQGTPEQQALAVRMATVEAPSLVLHTGDIAYPSGTFSQFEDNYFAYYAALMKRAPFFPSPGNHDYADSANNPTPYLTVHGVPAAGVPFEDRGRYYSFDWGDVHFVALDSNVPLLAAANQTGGMFEWLERDLSQTRQYWRVVYFHHPPYPTGFHRNDPNSALVRAHLLPIFERHHVSLVLCGHEHNYQRRRSAPEETTYIITGGGGAGLVPTFERPELAARAATHHYVRGDVSGSRMTLAAFDTGGRQIDSVVLAPPPRIAAAGVVNAASFTPALAPGSLVTIFGAYLAPEAAQASRFPLPREFSGTSVTVNGRPLPIFYVSPTQINVQLPFSLTGPATLRVATRNGEIEIPVSVDEAAPAIFTRFAFHLNGVPVSPSSPASPGEALVVYLTGLGDVKGTITAGEPAPAAPLLATSAPVEVEVGPASMVPLFSGLTPGFVGLYQLNLRLPPGIPPGEHTLRAVSRGSRSNSVSIVVQ